ncbi:hypothetical protein JKP88DRAFT_79394 [Tribonema minus]|uniref:Uncharacterized protein n=1 Tax=Tribonema minus TaxID=303371 RepID=A0A835YWU1_9STRA|nr:hypothetical protein JKP88DRAFT_79394 [Tribonema minus]
MVFSGRPLSTVAVCLAALLVIRSSCAAPLDAAVITEVDSYQGLLDVAGTVDDTDTGKRFEREVMMLLYEGGKCTADFKKHGLDEYGRLQPEDVALVAADVNKVDQVFLEKFGIVDDGDDMPCPTAVVIRQRSPLQNPTFEVVGSDPDDPFAIADGVLKSQEVHIGSVNDYDFPIKVMFVWRDGKERPHLRRLEPGRESWMKTYRSTELVARALDDGRELQRMRVRWHGLFTVAHRNCNIENCGIVERKEVELDEEEIRAREQNEKFRVRNNVQQPVGLPRFTDVGFKKIRVPDDVWDMLVTYYRQNKQNPKIERWGKGNVYTNNLEAPSYMVNLPETGPLKPAIFNGLRPILEEWSGVELVSTSCYGIRAYTRGSWLANHVDTRATHTISAIINVDQEVNKDWPLNIFDHAGNDHNITMAPRDMVLYESATCVHGRPSTFDGQFYANMFIHYKPTDPSKWIQER